MHTLEWVARALRSPHVPARAMGRQRATLSMPSYPRHRASNFRSHTSTHPTRVHSGCDALPSVSRLSYPNHQTFAFPPSQKRLLLRLPRKAVLGQLYIGQAIQRARRTKRP